MDAIRITGLWKGKDKNGNTFLSGNLNAISRVLVMPNTFKKEEKEPDYFFYITPQKKNNQKKENQKVMFEEL